MRSHGPLHVDDAIRGKTQLVVETHASDDLVVIVQKQSLHVQERSLRPVIASGAHINLVLGAGQAQRGGPVLVGRLTRGHAQHYLLVAHVLHAERLVRGAVLVGAQELHKGASALGDLQREGAGDGPVQHHGGHREGRHRQIHRSHTAHRAGVVVQRQTGGQHGLDAAVVQLV